MWGVWRWRLDHVRRSHGVMSRSSSNDRLDEFDVLLDGMSDMDELTIEPGDLDAELDALSAGSHTAVPVPLMNCVVADTLLCTDADTIRRRSAPTLHPGQGHYARNCKTGVAAALPPVESAVDEKVVAEKVVAEKPKKQKNGKPHKTVDKKVPSNSVDTLKKFQSREFKKASSLATEQGLSKDAVKAARQLAYKNATAVWKARHAI